MKKLLLSVLVLAFTLNVFAQTRQLREPYRKDVVKHTFQKTAIEPIGSKTAVFSPSPVPQSSLKNSEAVQILDIGQGGNAFGLSGGGRTALWADNSIKSVIFIHRMAVTGGYGNSRISFDISKDGGNTFWNNVQVYNPTGAAGTSGYPQAAGRYPQGGIYNPPGNTVANNAYGTYFVPTLDNSNGTGTWGGYGYGVRRLDTIPAFTQHNPTSHDGFHLNVPDAFTIAPNGDFWEFEGSVKDALATNYKDTMVLSHGTWNATTHDYDCAMSYFIWHSDKYIVDAKVAFGPDGNTGFMSVLSHDQADLLRDSTFYPILYKTVDAGVTWTGPIDVKLYGPGGIPAIKQYLTDSMLAILYTSVPPRDSMLYTTAWDHDLVVDANGNPHIGVVVGPGGGSWDIIKARDFIAMFDIYSPDGGTTWNAYYLDSLKNFDGAFTGTSTLTEYNRPQASRSQDGTMLFFSWLDTETPGTTTNTEPNIYCKRVDPIQGLVIQPTYNVTKFTPAYSVAYMAVASHYVFNHTGGGWTIPYVYQDMNPIASEAAVQYKYINNFNIIVQGIPVIEGSITSVSQNYPNPATTSTMIEVKLSRPADLGIEISNLVGQKVISIPAKTLASGTHDITIDCSPLRAGIYFYTVTAGKEKITKKMVIQ